MVKLFAKGTTSFGGNGKAVLTPTVCTVSEVAGGGYELHMEHPFDPEGRYLLLEDEEIIVAPVPPFHRDAITLPEMTIYIVNEDGTSVYSSLPRTTTDESKVDQIRKVKAAPGDYAWAPGTNYNVGALVTYGGRIYRAKQYNFAVTPGTANQVWGYVTTVAGTYTGDVTTIPGTVVETLPLDAQVFFLADYSQKYIRVRTVQGNEGYVAREKVTVTQDKQSGQVIPAKDITEQAFRIYSVTCEEELGSVVVEARHISYDFAGNALYKCELKQADPATAISMLRGTLMEPDNRVIACDIVTDQKITQDWSFRNPVNALLGQDDGLVPLLDAKLLRDNGDFYILDNSSPRQGITLAYGRNLTGVQWNRNTENVITRIVPRCNLSNGGFLYVDGIFVDSERISDYPVHRIEVMDCGYTIGQKYTPPEGGDDVVWTEETAKAQMLKDARERFTKQHVDSVAVSLTVEFLLLGDTEEFRQYRGLQRVNIYDEITVITGPSGMKSTAQVTEYEYDCILQRYNSIRVGRVNTFRRVPGFTLTSGSVTYSKLSPELVSLISGGTSTTGSSDDDSQADQPNGGAVLPPMTPVINDLTHTDTDKALSANMGRELDRGKKDKQEPVTDPTASGSGVQFISGISQDEQGVITPVKKTVRTMGGASASADGSSGLVPKPEAGEQGKFLRGDGEWASPAGTYSLPLAADGTRGGVQIGYSQNGKNYPVQLSGEKMFVNVPWTDTDHHAWDDITGKPATATRWPSWSEVTDKPTSFYTLPLAASGTRGGVKIGYTASDKKYPVQLDSNERAYVEVPWDNTQYGVVDTSGNGLCPQLPASGGLGKGLFGNGQWRYLTRYDDIISGQTSHTIRSYIQYLTDSCGVQSGWFFAHGNELQAPKDDNSPWIIEFFSTSNMGGCLELLAHRYGNNAEDYRGLFWRVGSDPIQWVRILNENDVTSWIATLSWGNTTAIARIGGVDINVALPANPNTWNPNAVTGISRSGTTFTATTAGGGSFTFDQQDTNTWNANTKDVAGYVAAPGAVANKVWKTDGSGNPAWRDDANTTYSRVTTSGDGLCPTLVSGVTNVSKFLRADGTWAPPARQTTLQSDVATNVTEYVKQLVNTKGIESGWFIVAPYTDNGAPNSTEWTVIEFFAAPDIGGCVELYAHTYNSLKVYRGYLWRNKTDLPTWVRMVPADEAIKSISRSGTTFTATRADGTTFTFTQQDNDTTYSAGAGLILSGTQFKLKYSNYPQEKTYTAGAGATLNMDCPSGSAWPNRTMFFLANSLNAVYFMKTSDSNMPNSGDAGTAMGCTITITNSGKRVTIVNNSTRDVYVNVITPSQVDEG